jgi:hypothetical protein
MTTPKKKATPMTTESMKNLAELANRAGRGMAGLIDAMSTRGAIKGEELFAVGQLREQSNQLTQVAEVVQSEIAKESES